MVDIVYLALLKISYCGRQFFSILPFLLRGLLGLLTFLFNFPLNHSIGIIGGADGPTATFVSAPEGYFECQMIVASILLIVSLLGHRALIHIQRKNTPLLKKAEG